VSTRNVPDEAQETAHYPLGRLPQTLHLGLLRFAMLLFPQHEAEEAPGAGVVPNGIEPEEEGEGIFTMTVIGILAHAAALRKGDGHAIRKTVIAETGDTLTWPEIIGMTVT